jgi:hypothetical protein
MEGSAVAEQLVPPGNVVTLPRRPFEAPVSDGSFLVNEDSLWLPPAELRRKSDLLIETPVDSKGLIDIPKLIDLVKATVDPEYAWPQGKCNESTHHWYWPEHLYPYEAGDEYSLGTFRNLPINKVELPRVFENWLHIVTEIPKVPHREVVEETIRSWRVSKDLYKSAQKMIWWERRARRRETIGQEMTEYPDDGYAVGFTAYALERHFRGVERHLAALESIDPEFRLIEPASNPHELATELGKYVTKQSMLAGRYVHAPSTLAA